MKVCILCGGVGHRHEDCPWEEAHFLGEVKQIALISFFVAILSIGSAIYIAMLVHDVILTLNQYIYLLAEVFIAASSGTGLSTAIYRSKFWKKLIV